ncbi:uncharacterized protein LOC129571540 [Sitodiplosis mosellana]|uniref:uncharacterized protein LOC129571540 n=1 Tax=Sitodiplosis mosellana TaxID=263140 RepID=UPI002444B928|nr:uncharacterized protein LOC129571540 [Sitodiplosis mosellana]
MGTTETLQNTSAEDSEALNLTTIDEDSRILIFEFLEWDDLARVADTSKKLYTAACDVYKRKYGKVTLITTPRYETDNSFTGTRIYRNRIYLWDPVISLKVVRNFGHITSHIAVGCRLPKDGKKTAFVSFLMSSLEKYCSKSLRELTDRTNNLLFLKEIRNPFINVEKIFCTWVSFSTSEIPFNTLFPNLKSLDVAWISGSTSEMPFCTLFPNLESLKTSISNKVAVRIASPSMKHLCITTPMFHEENIVYELLKLNPQLEKLEIDFKNIFRHIMFSRDVNLPKLKDLFLRTYFKTYNVQRYHFDNVTNFHLVVNSDLAYVPFTFNKLERFQFTSYYFSKSDTIPSHIFDFITENKHLKSITVSRLECGVTELFQLCSVLTNIEELYVEVRRPLPSSISELIRNLFSKNHSFKNLTLEGPKLHYGLEDLDDFIKSKISKREEYFSYSCFKIKLTLNP